MRVCFCLYFALFVLPITKRDSALAGWLSPEELIQDANAACSQNCTYEAAVLVVRSGHLRLNSLNSKMSCLPKYIPAYMESWKKILDTLKFSLIFGDYHWMIDKESLVC